MINVGAIEAGPGGGGGGGIPGARGGGGGGGIPVRDKSGGGGGGGIFFVSTLEFDGSNTGAGSGAFIDDDEQSVLSAVLDDDS